MKFKTAEKIFLVLVMIVASILFYGSSIVRIAFREPVTPRLFGQTISGLLFVVCTIRLIKLFLLKDNEEDKRIIIPRINLVITQIALMVLYAICITKIGYFVTTFFYLFGMILLLRDNNSKKNIVLYGIGSLLFTIGLYFLFKTFNVFLPNAWLF